MQVAGSNQNREAKQTRNKQPETSNILYNFYKNNIFLSMLTKNRTIKYGLLIKSIFLLPDNKHVNKQINRILWFNKHLDYRS
jgi:hypothetical protein